MKRTKEASEKFHSKNKRRWAIWFSEKASWEFWLFKARRATAGMQKQHESHADRIPSNSLWSIIHNQIMLLTSARIHEGIFQFSDFPTLDAERSASKKVLQSFIERNWNLLPSQTYHRLLCVDWKILISTFTSWLIRSIDSRIKGERKKVTCKS